MNAKDKTKILKLKQSGMTYKQIGKQFNVGAGRIIEIATEGVALIGHCQICWGNRRLSCHHINYWPEFTATVCGECHGQLHWRRKTPKK